VAALIAWSGVPSLPKAGCDVFDTPISESAQFTPADQQRDQAFDLPLPDLPLPATSQFASLPGVGTSALPPRQLELVSESGAAYGYYLDRPVAGMLVSDFIRSGGVEIDKEPMLDEMGFATRVLATLGDRATPVDVGPYQGALVWADPEQHGIRTHNLYWSDGIHNYAVIADLSAQATLNLGRVLVCDSKGS
jgi:hypothetical protein